MQNVYKSEKKTVTLKSRFRPYEPALFLFYMDNSASGT